MEQEHLDPRCGMLKNAEESSGMLKKAEESRGMLTKNVNVDSLVAHPGK